jgi:peptide/nickel transport system substrate-binding protein
MMRRREFLQIATVGGAMTLLTRRVHGKHEPEHAGVGRTNPPAASLDPRTATDLSSRNIFENILERLVRFEPNRMTIEPMLAESWEVTPDAIMWKFRLRQGVTFHNGRPFDAAAAKYSLEQVRDRLRVIQAIEIDDAFTIRIATAGPYGALLYLLAEEQAFMVPVNAYEERLGQPIGTGPYKLVDHIPGVKLELQQNETYHRRPPRVRRLSIYVVRESQAQVAMLRAGELQITDGHVEREFAARLNAAQIPPVESPFPRVIAISLNTQEAILRDPRVRVAMTLAINRRQIVTELMQKVRLIDFVALPESPASPREVSGHDYNPAQAKRLLAEAGFSGQVTLTSPERLRPLAELIAAGWKDVGINLEVKFLEPQTFLGNFQQRTLGMTYIFSLRPMFDASFTLDRFVHSKGEFSTSIKPEIDRLIEAARQSPDPGQRAAIYGDIAQKLKDDPPLIPLFQEVAVYGVKGARWKPRPDGLVLGSEIELAG